MKYLLQSALLGCVDDVASTITSTWKEPKFILFWSQANI